MGSRTSRTAGRLAVLALLVAGPGAASGCGSPREGAGAGGDAAASAHRARQVAAAWDGSTAAAAWRVGHHPMGDVVQLPRGGLRGKADRQAYRDRHFVLRGRLPTARPGDGKVAWAGEEVLTRPLQGADVAYRALAGDRTGGGGPHLTVTGAKLGGMTLATSRGPAVVPAWLFTLDGYDTPLKRAAAVPSKLPRPPIGEARDVPGLPLQNLVRIAADGRSVTVVALHGVCDEGPVVEVLETRGSVVLSTSVGQRKHEGLCTDQAKERQVTVRLDRALGDRVLLDAHTGRPVPYQPQNGPSPSWS
ncbi:hypothetical protein ACH4SP_36985 [Streptomyces sp. NPDC021093]|uniref:hypothetical protein n=1 Tax=Streptomyces sp. NPDC021093 TaxID=3365112 RepID=UPI0037883A9B